MLVSKFIEEIKGQELRALIYSSSALIHQGGWHTKKYFGKQLNSCYTLFLDVYRTY